MRLLLGIDTGGTYTDVVLYDEPAGAPRASAKVPTTHGDLALGIERGIDRVLNQAEAGTEHIQLVSLSTTLATNALVEGHGRAAGLVMIGFGEGALDRAGLRSQIDERTVVLAGGGHTPYGDEAAALDLDLIRSRVAQMATDVEAIAVAAQFSVRNPAHELAARDAIRADTGLPVTCSHELSSALNGPKRALTALLNARLVAVTHELLRAARAILEARAIAAPLMVVRGDGSLVSADFVAARPIETVLSGPAASVIGAHHLTRLADAVVADIGGTTTDIAVIRDGHPELSSDGATVAGHRTMVRAIRMHTFGLGGDSALEVDDAADAGVRVGPHRRIPLCRLAADHRELVSGTLDRQLLASKPDELHGIFVVPPDAPAGMTDRERAMVGTLDGAPHAADRVVTSRRDLGVLQRLAARGVVRLAAFTPTDACHVLGLQDDHDPKVAHQGAEIFARRRTRLGAPFARDAAGAATAVIEAVVRGSAEALLAAALERDGISTTPADSGLIAAAFNRMAETTRLDIGVRVPIIGLGAGAHTYHVRAARLLNARPTIPEAAGVANAIGAVVGRVVTSATTLVTSPRRGTFRVHARPEPVTVHNLAAARVMATDHARRAAIEEASRAGAGDVEVAIDWAVRDVDMPGKPLFMEATATATAIGRPAYR
ncbi:MAG: hydantoinase/oxoprolinase family protein [Acidimicrobiia bacterium]|nr:hydantoinase/oxoprolinase family protein [Acidimicrobiia bacterium]